MQNAQLLSQPIWIVTQALYDVSRRAGQRRREHRLIVDHGLGQDLGDRSIRLGGLGKQFGGAVHVVGAHHDVDVTGPGGHEVLVLLRQTTRHDDLTTFALALPRLEVAEVAVQLVVRVLPDAARVEDHDVGVGLTVGANEPVGFEQTGDPLRVVLVHLTPVGAHDVAAGHGPRGYWPGPFRRRSLSCPP